MTDDTRQWLTRRRMLQGSGAGLATALAGCSGSGDGGDGGSDGDDGQTTTTQGEQTTTQNQNEVHVLTDYTSEAWQTTWEEDAVPGFEEKTNIPVRVEYAGMQGPGEQRLLTLLQAGKPPELYTATSSQISNLMVEGQTAELGDTVANLEEQNGSMLFKNTVSLGGEVHMMPHGLYLGGTFNYRTDLYDKLSLEAPETWEDLLNNAEAIDNDKDIDARGFAISAVKAGKSGSDWSNFFRNAGGGLFQWKSDSQEEAEIWFDEDQAVETLEFMNQLSEYSPDPSSISWASTLKYWAGGRIGQTVMNNAWNVGVAYRAGATSVAKNTDVGLIPKQKGADPIDRGWALIDGTPVISSSDNPEGGKRLWTYMYDTPQKVIDKIHTEPMRFLPPYEGVIEEDAYQQADIFQAEDGYFLDLNRKLMEEVAPHMSSPERPSTPASFYESRFQYDSEMMNAVLVQDVAPKQAYQNAYADLERLFQEGKEKAQGNF